MKEGLKEGLEKGEYQKAVKMAVKLKTKGASVEEIAELTELTVEEIQAL